MADSIPVNVVSLEDIFSAPLRAVVSADFDAARQFAAYVEEYGFIPPEPGAPQADSGADPLGRLRMVSFRFEEMGADFVPHPVEMKIPALSLVPLPLLQVEDADFTFGVRLLQGTRRHESRPLRLLQAAGEPDPPRPPVQWQAMIADRSLADPRRDQAAPQLNANIHAQVRMRRAEIPAGIATLLGVMGSVAQVTAPVPPTLPEAT
jgi:Protein of unknown function (DUF2589)